MSIRYARSTPLRCGPLRRRRESDTFLNLKVLRALWKEYVPCAGKPHILSTLTLSGSHGRENCIVQGILFPLYRNRIVDAISLPCYNTEHVLWGAL